MDQRTTSVTVVPRGLTSLEARERLARDGPNLMPEGKRRTIYQERLEQEVLPTFAGRVLAFDLDTSRAYADLMARARAEGKAIGKADGYIAVFEVANVRHDHVLSFDIIRRVCDLD